MISVPVSSSGTPLRPFGDHGRDRSRRAARVFGGAVATAGLGYAVLHVLGRTSGSTRTERRRVLPGDELVKDPTVVTNHAVTIDAGPEAVWPWLTQMGWHRGGWYTPRWVDRLLFPANWPSAERLEPALVRDLRVGDSFPDGEPGTAELLVEQAEPPHVLVLHSTTHVPVQWRQRWGAAIDWVWTFALDERPGGRTRLQLRTQGRTRPWWLTAAYVGALVPADHVMATGMLHGIKLRVEGWQARRPAPD